jgi:AcrR family transcriptional regulator
VKVVFIAQKGNRTEAGARTRVAILKAAVRLLGRERPDMLSASALAKETGVSKATIFHHFHTLDEIPVVALEQFWMRSLDFNAGRKKQLAPTWRNSAGRWPARSSFLRAHVVFLTNAVFDTSLRRRLAAGSVQMRREMIRELSVRLPKPSPPSDVEAIARVTETFLDGMMVNLAIHGKRGLANASQVWTQFIDLLLSQVEKRR